MSPSPYYADESVTLYHGDAEDLLPGLRGDAVLTDPPYGVGVDYGESYDDSRPDYWEWLNRLIVLMRQAAPFVAFTHRVPSLREVTGWDWVGVWNKPYASGSRIGNSPVLPHWEPVYLYGIHRLGVVSGQHTSDVLNVDPVKSGNEGGFIGREKWAKGANVSHPCVKPIGLYHRLLKAYTQPTQTVLDPFAGSGTTLMAAKNLGRKSIGIEIEERYCESIALRCSQEVLELSA